MRENREKPQEALEVIWFCSDWQVPVAYNLPLLWTKSGLQSVSPPESSLMNSVHPKEQCSWDKSYTGSVLGCYARSLPTQCMLLEIVWLCVCVCGGGILSFSHCRTVWVLACVVCMHLRRNCFVFFPNVCAPHGNFKMLQSGEVCLKVELKTVQTLY